LFGERSTRCLDSLSNGVDESTQDDSSSSLDIIIPHEVGVSIPLEVVEGSLRREVLELKLDFGEDLLDGVNELVQELLVLSDGSSNLSKTEVEGIGEESRVISPHVETEERPRKEDEEKKSDRVRPVEERTTELTRWER